MTICCCKNKAWFPLLICTIIHIVCNSSSCCEAWSMIMRIERAALLKKKNFNALCVSSTSLSLAAGDGDGITRMHGQKACFLPLQSLAQDYYAPRIVQIAGAYPGLTKGDFEGVTSEEAPTPGQWSYDFSDPNGPQMGTVALEGGKVVTECDDPVAIISDHITLGVTLPPSLTDPVDLLLLVDRSKTQFEERKFFVVHTNGELFIGAFPEKSDLPHGAEILGRVDMVQIPWLPAMKPTKSGFQEVDELYSG